MPSGGKRKGAGRKPKLEPMARLAVGAHCERLWSDEYEAKLAKEVDASLVNVHNEHKSAHRIPIKERKAWVKSEAGQNHIEDVEDALRLDQGLSDEDIPSRLIQVKAKRPKGIRSKIMKAVAEAEGISPRMAESCWKEFRRFQNEESS